MKICTDDFDDTSLSKGYKMSATLNAYLEYSEGISALNLHTSFFN